MHPERRRRLKLVVVAGTLLLSILAGVSVTTLNNSGLPQAEPQRPLSANPAPGRLDPRLSITPTVKYPFMKK